MSCIFVALWNDAARLLSVCWYSPDLVFAGNAESCILRFSRAGPQQTFIADGKMVLDSQPVAGTSADGKQSTQNLKDTFKPKLAARGLSNHRRSRLLRAQQVQRRWCGTSELCLDVRCSSAVTVGAG